MTKIISAIGMKIKKNGIKKLKELIDGWLLEIAIKLYIE